MKCNLYVNDVLGEKIEKHRESLSLSEVFARAVSQRIEELESISLVEDEVEALVKRLRDDSDESYQSGRVEGVRHGREWAKDAASLGDLKYVVEHPTEKTMIVLQHDWYEGYRPFDVILESAGDGPSSDGESWSRGYLDGFKQSVEDVWGSVEKYLPIESRRV